MDSLLLAAACKSTDGEVFNLGGLETVTLSALGELLRESKLISKITIRIYGKLRQRRVAAENPTDRRLHANARLIHSKHHPRVGFR